MESFTLSASEEISMMSADNRPMTVLPKVDADGDYALELLPRVRYRIKTPAATKPSIVFESGLLVVPESDGEHSVVINLSDRMASTKCGGRPTERQRTNWRQDPDDN